MMITKRRLITFGSIFFLLIILLVGVHDWQKDHPPITIITANQPVNIQLNNYSYVLTHATTVLRLPKASYNYRATFGTGSSAIILYGNTDTTEGLPSTIRLNYSVFSKANIIKVLCKTGNYTSQNCIFNQAHLSITYLLDSSWAVVNASFPAMESSQTVLELNQGAWEVIAGPGSGLNLSGAVPQAVEEALGND